MGIIEVIGLGSGNEEELSEASIKRMQQVGEIYMRTADFPLVSYIRSQGISVHSFDEIYEAHAQFDDVYNAITNRLITLSKEVECVIYAVPGHPRVAERTVPLLLSAGKQEGIEIKIYGGHSFLDQTFHAFGFDPIEGFLLLDGTALHEHQLNPSLHIVIAQIYDRLTASDVKLTLMQSYPDEYEVWLGSYIGTNQQSMRSLRLYEIDQIDEWNNFSLLYVPPALAEEVQYRRFSYVKDIVTTLRSPEGCPWDREQTHESIRKNLIEETYEVLEAIDTGDIDNLQEELGDLLLQILLHSQIAAEEGFFDVHDVIYSLSEKLIRRHPHVFGEKKANNANEALQNWQEMKMREQFAQGVEQARSQLSGIPRDLPAVLTAYKLQKKAAEVGFDWTELEDVVNKVLEEWQELQEAIDQSDRVEEFGDLLFALVNLARFLHIDPEEALAKTNLKFKQRFAYIEQKLKSRNQELRKASLAEMEELWQEAKNIK